jgi:hypothetical protein
LRVFLPSPSEPSNKVDGIGSTTREKMSIIISTTCLDAGIIPQVGIVCAHEEPHPVRVLQNLAPNNLATVTAEAHRSVDPVWHLYIDLRFGEEF